MLEAIGDMLMEAGASSYTTQDADADTPSESPSSANRSGTKVQAWEPLASCRSSRWFRLETSLAVIEKALGIEKLGEVRGSVPDVDWVRITQAQFQPIQASAQALDCASGPNRRPLTRSI